MGSTTKLIWDSAMKSDENNSLILGKSGGGNSFNIKSALINAIFKEDKETNKVNSSKNN